MDQSEKPARKPRKPKMEGVPEMPPVEEPKKPRARRTPAASAPVAPEPTPAKRPARPRKTTPPPETPAVSPAAAAAIEPPVPAAPPVAGDAPIEPPPIVIPEPQIVLPEESTPPRPMPDALPVPHDEPDLFKPLSATPPATPAPTPTPPKRATLTMPNAQQISAAASQGQKLAQQNSLHLMADLRQALLRVIAAARSAGSWLDRALVGLARPYGDIKKSLQENVQHWEESIQKSDSVVIISTFVLAVCLLAIIGLIVSAFQW